tara:strand:- start:92 stop:382 length:291 start_codon:yes stop_codon:yes gene_type:complete
MTDTEFLTLCKEAINKRKAMIEAKKKNIVRQLIEGVYVQMEGLQGVKKGYLFQAYLNKQEGDAVYLKGYRSPFTIEGDYLKRGKDLWLIEGQNGDK